VGIPKGIRKLLSTGRSETTGCASGTLD